MGERASHAGQRGSRRPYPEGIGADYERHDSGGREVRSGPLRSTLGGTGGRGHGHGGRSHGLRKGCDGQPLGGPREARALRKGSREGRGLVASALLLALIRRSAWKVNSAKSAGGVSRSWAADILMCVASAALRGGR